MDPEHTFRSCETSRIQKAAETLITRYKEGDIAQNKFELQQIRKDGTIIDVELTANLLFDDAREIIGFQGRSIDITERKKVEKELIESEKRFREMANLLPQVVYEADPSGILTFVNEQAYDISGYSRDDVENGLNLYEIIIPEDREKAKENIMKKMMGGHVKSHEYTVKRKDGSTFPAMIYSNQLIKEDKLAGLRGIVVDISERKKKEEELRKLSTAMEQSPAAVGITDLEGNLVYVNPRFTQMTGYAPEELIGNNPRVLKSGDTSDEEYHTLWETITTKGTWKGEFHNKRKNGSLYWESAQISPIFDEKGDITHYIKVAEDITDRKRVEKALEESEELHRTLVETTLEGYWRVDANLISVDVNKSLCDMLGYSREEIIGIHIHDFFDENNLKLIKEQTSKISSTRSQNYEIPIIRRDGELLHAHFKATTLPEKNGIEQGSFAFITDRTAQKELMDRLILANDELKEAQEATLNILEDLKRENDERIMAEKGKKKEMNRAEFYLDLLGHDIGNLHQGIDAWIEIGRMSIDNKEKVAVALDNSKKITEETLRLVRSVLLLSRLNVVEKLEKDIDLVKLLEETVKNVKRVFSNKKLGIKVKCNEKNINIKAEEIISEVFFNLLHNSIKFQNLEEAQLEIELRKDEKEGKAVLEIADHGSGIPDKMKKTLFDRSKEPTKKAHTGIGLLLVKALVDRHSGTIRVEDRVKGDRTKGTRFIVELPMAEQ
ncbi:MAG: PAS domain S-box protein [Candidatus Thermoplasmatota archaeon]|nr:PAS domain S-box protein [Candidatus Thermoplasmatota archaeon]